MAQIHFEVDDELHRLVKVTAAHRGVSIREAFTIFAWWFVDGTDHLMLDVCEEVLNEVMPQEIARIAFGRAQMRMDATRQQRGGEEG